MASHRLIIVGLLVPLCSAPISRCYGECLLIRSSCVFDRALWLAGTEDAACIEGTYGLNEPLPEMEHYRTFDKCEITSTFERGEDVLGCDCATEHVAALNGMTSGQEILVVVQLWPFHCLTGGASSETCDALSTWLRNLGNNLRLLPTVQSWPYAVPVKLWLMVEGQVH